MLSTIVLQRCRVGPSAEYAVFRAAARLGRTRPCAYGSRQLAGPVWGLHAMHGLLACRHISCAIIENVLEQFRVVQSQRQKVHNATVALKHEQKP